MTNFKTKFSSAVFMLGILMLFSIFAFPLNTVNAGCSPEEYNKCALNSNGSEDFNSCMVKAGCDLTANPPSTTEPANSVGTSGGTSAGDSGTSGGTSAGNSGTSGGTSAGSGTSGGTSAGDSGTSGGTSAGTISIGIYNPLKAQTLQELATNIIEFLIQLGIPVIVFMIIYAGFLYVTARGNPEQISKAHSTLLWTLIGTAVLLGSMVIVEVVKKTIDVIAVK